MFNKSSQVDETQADQNASLADALLAAIKTIAPPQSGITPEQLREVLLDNTQATQKALRPENARHPDISAFNPEGERDHPRPALKYKVVFAGIELRDDDLTRTEIELLNRFTHTCLARAGQWKADLSNGKLVISLPVASTDDRMNLPNGMTLILRELLDGEKAVDTESLAARVAELEKALAAKS